LILLRIYVTEIPPPPDVPTHREIEDFMNSINADYYIYDVNVNRTYFYTASPLRPLVVVQPRTEDEIRKVLPFVKKYGSFPFSIKVGGHSTAGYCLNDNGLVLDLSKHLNNISWADGTQSALIIEGGVTWDKVYQFLAPYGKGVTGPQSPTVGVVGFLLGGGMSRYSALYGLGIDNVEEITLILANGTKSVTSQNVHSDLFWALRGGGGGNFGVVLSVRIRTFDMMLYSRVQACWDDINVIPGVLDLWATTITDTQTERYYAFEIYRTSIDIGFCVFIQERNTTQDALIQLLAPLFTVEPYDDIYPRNFTTIQPDPYETFAFDYQYTKSLVLDITAFDSNMNTILRNALTTMKDIPIITITYENFGKQANLPLPTDTAFPHRNRSGVLHLKTIWPTLFDSVLGDAARAEANTFLNYLSRFDKGAYINYIDPGLNHWSQAYYAQNYNKLKIIKEITDPTHFYKFSQSIGSE